MVPRENKKMIMQNLGGKRKNIMVFSEVAYSGAFFCTTAELLSPYEPVRHLEHYFCS